MANIIFYVTEFRQNQMRNLYIFISLHSTWWMWWQWQEGWFLNLLSIGWIW